jgi:hypothetical protein
LAADSDSDSAAAIEAPTKAEQPETAQTPAAT